MKVNPKHKSKLHKGFEKQVARQDAKPSIKYIEVKPTILSYDEEEGKYLPLKKTVWNNKWNGMNLKNIANSFSQTMPNWFNSHRRLTKNGKYKLSIRGKQYLNRKKSKLYNSN